MKNEYADKKATGIIDSATTMSAVSKEMLYGTWQFQSNHQNHSGYAAKKGAQNKMWWTVRYYCC